MIVIEPLVNINMVYDDRKLANHQLYNAQGELQLDDKQSTPYQVYRSVR
jgi:hypothetical protein